MTMQLLRLLKCIMVVYISNALLEQIQFCQFFNSYTFLLLISANLSLKNFTNLQKLSVISIYK